MNNLSEGGRHHEFTTTTTADILRCRGSDKQGAVLIRRFNILDGGGSASSEEAGLKQLAIAMSLQKLAQQRGRTGPNAALGRRRRRRSRRRGRDCVIWSRASTLGSHSATSSSSRSVSFTVFHYVGSRQHFVVAAAVLQRCSPLNRQEQHVIPAAVERGEDTPDAAAVERDHRRAQRHCIFRSRRGCCCGGWFRGHYHCTATTTLFFVLLFCVVVDGNRSCCRCGIQGVPAARGGLRHERRR